METWFMECVAFGCVAVGVCAIVYCTVRAIRFLLKYQRDEEFARMEDQLKAKDEQIAGLRSTIDRLKKEYCAIERENKK